MLIEEYFQQDRTEKVGRGSNGEMPTILKQALNGSAITYRWIIDQKNTINHMENLFDGILIHREIVRGERRKRGAIKVKWSSTKEKTLVSQLIQIRSFGATLIQL